MERVTCKYILPYIKQTANENLLYDSENSNHVDVWQKPIQYCKPIILQSKINIYVFLKRPKSKITADGDCSHEIKRRLLLGRKVMTNLDSIFKSRDITLPTKIHVVKAMVFPVALS